MAIDLLDAPVRLTWDLHGPAGQLTGEDMLAVADRIAAAGVFYVTLEERPLAHPSVAQVLMRLAAGGCRATVVCTGSEPELAAIAGLPLPRPAVLFDVSGYLLDGNLDDHHLRRILARFRENALDPSLLLTPQRSNLSVIPKLFDFCQRQGVGCLKLPNARIGDTYRSQVADDLPRWDDLASFREAWAEIVPTSGRPPVLEIHDRFLWEIMTPGDDRSRSEYGGCQAANSLGHIDAYGNVYACAAWPVLLGALPAMELEEIWQSPQRFAVRARVAAMPPGCQGCRDDQLCLGGCRGLGERLGQAGGGRDLMCRAPRN